MVHKATWTKGKKTITGRYQWSWAYQVFYVSLDKKCSITGRMIDLTVSGESPEFNGWKLKDDQETRDTKEEKEEREAVLSSQRKK